MKIDQSELNSRNVMAVNKEVKTAIANHDYVVDLSSVEEFDSSAIAAALEWVRTAQLEGEQLQLINVPDKFWKLAELYRIRHFLEQPEKPA